MQSQRPALQVPASSAAVEGSAATERSQQLAPEEHPDADDDRCADSNHPKRTRTYGNSEDTVTSIIRLSIMCMSEQFLLSLMLADITAASERVRLSVCVCVCVCVCVLCACI